MLRGLRKLLRVVVNDEEEGGESLKEMQKAVEEAIVVILFEFLWSLWFWMRG